MKPCGTASLPSDLLGIRARSVVDPRRIRHRIRSSEIRNRGSSWHGSEFPGTVFVRPIRGSEIPNHGSDGASPTDPYGLCILVWILGGLGGERFVQH